MLSESNLPISVLFRSLIDHFSGELNMLNRLAMLAIAGAALVLVGAGLISV